MIGQNNYAYNNDRLSKVSSNSTSYNFTYDGNGNTVAYVYDNSGNLAISQDLKSGITNKYTYDLADRLVKTEDSNGN